ncbi:MAG: hypothetical protein JXD22_03725 [Sedimentisphaerales bacterium]|nr:hypothetical protein [Sedimentisphaerales bacterium]
MLCKSQVKAGREMGILEEVSGLGRVGQLAGGAMRALVMREGVEGMQARLDRVRSWGGQFSEIDFSPEMKAMAGGG